MKVSAVIVTRGDVDLTPIRDSLPKDWQMLVWDNGAGECREWTQDHAMWVPSFRWDASDLGVYGRYAAIEYASGDLIYVQDDDCVLPPEGIAQMVARYPSAPYDATGNDGWPVIANLPGPFRVQDFYRDHCLVGFGAVFHRDAPKRAFDRWYGTKIDESKNGEWGLFRNTCDIVFTGLTPRVLVDVPYENLPWADGPDRMYRQPEHIQERQRMLDLVRKVRDG